MNRRNFLKSIGVGIAAAVIAPKLLIEKPGEVVAPAPKVSPFGIYEDEVKMLHYAHYEEDFPKYTIDDLRIHDLCVDKDARVWMCTAMWPDKVELTALLAEPEPNFLEVRRKNFDEYFIIMGSVFSAGTGMPTRR
jgi:hypothetical protein